jgi:hypothetical protein
MCYLVASVHTETTELSMVNGADSFVLFDFQQRILVVDEERSIL